MVPGGLKFKVHRKLENRYTPSVMPNMEGFTLTHQNLTKMCNFLLNKWFHFLRQNTWRKSSTACCTATLE